MDQIAPLRQVLGNLEIKEQKATIRFLQVAIVCYVGLVPHGQRSMGAAVLEVSFACRG